MSEYAGRWRVPAGRVGARGRSLARLALGALLLLAGCATAGSTLGSGVGDRLLDRPPYSAGERIDRAAAGSVAHLPIGYQRGALQEPIFEPEDGRGSAVGALLAEMNAYLESMGVSTRLEMAPAPRNLPPDVQFGCEQDPSGECVAASRDASVAGKPWMRLAVGRPSAGWVASVRSALDRVGAASALVITLEVGQYWTHQRNLRGSKEVRLGAGHSVDVPWLTSLDQPVQVLQLTGALLDAEGRAIRIAAEGLHARPTHLLLSSFGAQEVIGDEDVRRLLEARREDLPGRPLVWQAALRALVVELTGAAPT